MILADEMCAYATLLHLINGIFSGTTWVSRYQKGKTSLHLNDTRDYGVLGRQWHQLDHIRVVRGSILCDPTQPNPLQMEKFEPNPIQLTTEHTV